MKTLARKCQHGTKSATAMVESRQSMQTGGAERATTANRDSLTVTDVGVPSETPVTMTVTLRSSD
jgi:hypothetical protein